MENNRRNFLKNVILLGAAFSTSCLFDVENYDAKNNNKGKRPNRPVTSSFDSGVSGSFDSGVSGSCHFISSSVSCSFF